MPQRQKPFMNKRVPIWVQSKVRKIMEHNSHEFPNDITVKECEKKDLWTPIDLSLREDINNGSGSSKGFLGILPHENKKLSQWIRENAQLLKELDYLSEFGWNNFGILLWSNWTLPKEQ